MASITVQQIGTTGTATPDKIAAARPPVVESTITGWYALLSQRAPTIMAIKFLCSSCKKVVSVKDEFAGRKGKCPHCGNVLTVPRRPGRRLARFRRRPSRPASAATRSERPAAFEAD